MFFGDHDPPDFHARYAGRSARVDLDGSLLNGSLPTRAERLVREGAYTVTSWRRDGNEPSEMNRQVPLSPSG